MKDEVTVAGDITALQRQVGELTGQVRDLKRQRISMDREVKMQRAWVDGELKKCVIAAQVQQVEGCLSELATVKEQVPYPMDVQECIEDLYEWRGELEERAMAAQVQPVEGCFSELAAVKEQVGRMEQRGGSAGRAVAGQGVGDTGGRLNDEENGASGGGEYAGARDR